MELQTITQLMEQFSRLGLTGLELEEQGTRLVLRKETAASVPAAPSAPSAPVSAAEADPTLDEIPSPLVGTFYAAPSPEEPPFVSAGDKVKKGQTICILEAMKAMTEIPAPMDCIIEEVLVENGALVGYNAPLFRVRKG